MGDSRYMEAGISLEDHFPFGVTSVRLSLRHLQWRWEELQRPETFCREQTKLRYRLDVKVSKRKSGVPLELLAVAFGWTQFLAPITQPGRPG